MAVDSRVLRRALVDTVRDHGPGLYAPVTEHGEVVCDDAVGVADLADGRPITGRDRYRIGSLTKMYVSALVLRLAADGVLALTDTVQRWLPDPVPGGDAITVELLLRMRSGLPDYTAAVLGDPPDLAALQRYWSPQTLVRLALGRDDRVAPDSTHRYCNTDYVLLGLIVERATGERLDAQLWQRIFTPLGLDETTFPPSTRSCAARTRPATCARRPARPTPTAQSSPHQRHGAPARSWPPRPTSRPSWTACSPGACSTPQA